eukprot:gene23327-31658_t
MKQKTQKSDGNDDEIVEGIVGAATTFVSHAWAAKFGDLVSAISDNADLSRKIWLDIFAENQWPSRCQPDLPRLEITIRHCTSLLLVCSSAASRADTTKKIGFFRLWCMYELYCAINIPGMAVVVKGDKQDCDVDTQMMRSMMQRADVRTADCSSPRDKEVILDKLRRSAGGLDAVNRAIRDEPYHYIHSAANNGYTRVIEAAVLAVSGPDRLALMNAKDSEGNTPLLRAAKGGRSHCIQYLIERGCNVSERNNLGESAAMLAAKGGHLTCLQHIVEYHCDVYNDGMSAAMHAARSGHLTCLQLLIEKGFSVNSKNRNGG